MKSRIKLLVVSFFIMMIVVACNSSTEELQDSISTNELIDSEDNSDLVSVDTPEKVEERILADVDANIVVDSMFDKINESPCEQARYIVTSKIDFDKKIGYEKYQLKMDVSADVRYQISDNGPEMLFDGEGLWAQKKNSNHLDIEVYYGNISDNNAFYFNDFVNYSDWYYLESNMIDNLVDNAESLESSLGNYLYLSKIYESEYNGKECYQIVLDVDGQKYVNIIGIFFTQGEVSRYWDAWLDGFNRVRDISLADFFEELNLETSIYVSKQDYSFVAATVCTEGVDISVSLLDEAPDVFTIPDRIDSVAVDYTNDSNRDGLVDFISKRLFIYGYDPSYYCDDDGTVRLLDEQYNEIYKFSVPEDYQVFYYSKTDGTQWFLVNDETLTGFEFTTISPGHLEIPYIWITENFYGSDYVQTYPDRDYYEYQWVSYMYEGDAIHVAKRTSLEDGSIEYEAFFSYSSEDSNGEKEYVLCIFKNYGDYPIDSGKVRELVLAIVE